MIITNPVCPDCLSTEMKVFVAEVDPELANQISPFHVPGDTTCIQCGITMGLCAHCSCKDIYLQVKDTNPTLAKDFMGRFDYDLRKNFM
ncbi:TPA: hypothetical protein HA278_04515 [Candidatus Woesearchaeota archaeon]|nr:hypothetical protein [Candidatus Woesearchaeota archaeon]